MISLFCPSRGRPKQAAELLESFNQTKTTQDVELIYLLDYDDIGSEPYGSAHILMPPGTRPIGEMLNFAVHHSNANIVGFIGDDSRFLTNGWDARVAEVLKEPGFCWAHDGHRLMWPSTAFVSREIVEALGWFVLPGLQRTYFDEVWFDLAHATHSARELPEHVFLHDNSPGDPKSPNFNPVMQTPPDICISDEKVFRAWRDGPQFAKDVSKVAKVVLSGFFV